MQHLISINHRFVIILSKRNRNRNTTDAINKTCKWRVFDLSEKIEFSQKIIYRSHMKKVWCIKQLIWILDNEECYHSYDKKRKHTAETVILFITYIYIRNALYTTYFFILLPYDLANITKKKISEYIFFSSIHSVTCVIRCGNDRFYFWL